MHKCHDCGQACYDDRYPELVFRSGNTCICEECSIDWTQDDGDLKRRSEEVA